MTDATVQVVPFGDGQVLAILGFHKIGAPPAGHHPTWFYVAENRFAACLSFLEQEQWTILDLGRFLRGLSEPRSLPKRTALLTFDDGYQSMLDVTLPWLRRFKYPAVLFVPTDFIGGLNTFDKDVEPEEPICDWRALRELSENGVSVQSHGVSHTRFSELTAATQETELRRSKAVLEAGLGRPVEMFSYPYGDHGLEACETGRLLRATGYSAACLFGDGTNRVPITDRYLLERVAIGPDTDVARELAEAPAGRSAPRA